MFIVHGKYAMGYNIGWVGDICYRCRAPRTHKLEEVCMTSHLYLIPLSRGPLVGYRKACQTCRMRTSTTIARFTEPYYGTKPKTETEVLDLLESTSPNVLPELEKFYKFEQTVVEGKDTTEERVEYMIVALTPLIMDFQVESSKTYADGISAAALIGCFVLFGTSGWLSQNSNFAGSWAAGISSGGLLIYFAYRLYTAHPRRLRQKFGPIFRDMFKHFSPAAEEWNAVKTRYAGSNFANLLNVDWAVARTANSDR